MHDVEYLGILKEDIISQYRKDEEKYGFETNEGVILIVDTPEFSRSLYEDCSEFLGNYVNVIHVPEIDTHPMSGLEFGSFSNIERNGSISKILDLKNKNFLAIT